ncbi:hypothetical protein QBC36DRAFT_125088 [Triangularia setosa]|uniref:Uncharacterized protein n=1 Tax=Triangularia setosa TaxID=2587417 RepID=A0AAN6W9C9_9PEZI|nr:hypothetical protein QBC36DRAFT_125088 [Podospora setosa]
MRRLLQYLRGNPPALAVLVQPEMLLTILAVAISVDQFVSILAITGAAVLSFCFWLHVIAPSPGYLLISGHCGCTKLEPDCVPGPEVTTVNIPNNSSSPEESPSKVQLDEGACHPGVPAGQPVPEGNRPAKEACEELSPNEETLGLTPVGGSSENSWEERSQSVEEESVKGGPAKNERATDRVEGLVLEVPSWFLDHNLKTASELSGRTPKLVIKRERSVPPSGPHAEDAVFEIKSSVYHGFWAVLSNPAQTWESAYEQGMPFFAKPSFLLTAINTTYGARGYRAFFRAAVEQFATDIGAGLITLDIEDARARCHPARACESLLHHFPQRFRHPRGTDASPDRRGSNTCASENSSSGQIS